MTFDVNIFLEKRERVFSDLNEGVSQRLQQCTTHRRLTDDEKIPKRTEPDDGFDARSVTRCEKEGLERVLLLCCYRGK